MARPTPLLAKKKVKKQGTHVFRRWQHDRFKCVKPSWRKPKGIDGRVRRRFKGTIAMPNIGYGTDKKTKHYMPNGFLKFRVFNVKELELLMMHNRKYVAEIAHNVSTRKRREIVNRAEELNIRVSNGNAKIRTEEDE
ncbi:MAG: 50S ribosomal protein L32e [Crocinitomicaceae bacterium]|nr:50S ribosomal protein L32e [Crocinitomicaceae bacterium]